MPFYTIGATLRVWDLLATRALYRRLLALSPSEWLIVKPYSIAST
jgi:hypothetical protein